MITTLDNLKLGERSVEEVHPLVRDIVRFVFRCNRSSLSLEMFFSGVDELIFGVLDVLGMMKVYSVCQKAYCLNYILSDHSAVKNFPELEGKQKLTTW